MANKSTLSAELAVGDQADRLHHARVVGVAGIARSTQINALGRGQPTAASGA